MQYSERWRRIARHLHIDRQHFSDSARADKASTKDSARQRASSYCYDSFRPRHRVVRLLQRHWHVVGKRADHEHHVSMARCRSQEEAESVHVVVRIVELLDLIETGAAIA